MTLSKQFFSVFIASLMIGASANTQNLNNVQQTSTNLEGNTIHELSSTTVQTNNRLNALKKFLTTATITTAIQCVKMDFDMNYLLRLSNSIHSTPYAKTFISIKHLNETLPNILVEPNPYTDKLFLYTDSAISLGFFALFCYYGVHTLVDLYRVIKPKVESLPPAQDKKIAGAVQSLTA